MLIRLDFRQLDVQTLEKAGIITQKNSAYNQRVSQLLNSTPSQSKLGQSPTLS